MRTNPRLPQLTTLTRKTWKPVLFQGCPRWRQSVRNVQVIGDLNARTFAELDYLFAIFASNGVTIFSVTATGTKLQRWLESVERRSVGAAEKYEKQKRAQFQACKTKFMEGYTIPEPPTPQLRVVYDSAARSENMRDRGFSGGEYHWRSWPLDNVVDETPF